MTRREAILGYLDARRGEWVPIDVLADAASCNTYEVFAAIRADLLAGDIERMTHSEVRFYRLT